MSEEQENIPFTKFSIKKEKFLFFNTLACLVKSLEGHYTLIDLRNECSIAGKIVEVDGFMNTEMEEAIFIDSRGVEQTFSNFFVRHRNIRYVHIPKELSPLELIQNQFGGMKRIRPTKKRTFKQLRAERYQKQIVQSLNK